MVGNSIALGFQLIAECSLDGILLSDELGNIQLANPALEKLLGITKAELLGRNIADFFQTNLIAEWNARRIDFQQSQHCTRRVHANRRNGDSFLAEIRIQQAGVREVPGLIFIVRDISELESARIRLKQQEALLNEIPEPIHIVDPSGTIVYWNHGAELLFGCKASEAIGRFEGDLLTLQHPAHEHIEWQEVYKSTDRWAGELLVTTENGSVLRIERRKTGIWEGKEKIGDVVFDINLHERSQARLLERRRQRLESLGTLASGIAHDLNNLLTPIMMSCNMLKRPDVNLDKEALLETISSGASRGKSLISQLLTFARGGDGQHCIISLESVIQEVSAILRPTLPQDVLLELRFESGLPKVLGDDTEIGQAMMNILVNARDAIGDCGKIEVIVEPISLKSDQTYTIASLGPGQYVRVKVKDDGPGMSAAVRDHMFDPFYSTKERGQGTGLGLSTVLGILQSHHGAVDVQSKIGVGTTISILLPVYKPARA